MNKAQPTLEEIKAVEGSFYEIFSHIKGQLPEGSEDATVIKCMEHFGKQILEKRKKEAAEDKRAGFVKQSAASDS
tara:strand:- start:1082 stop:1306 length:225 start_codon:yes stop_codon:yes gene_type:complete